MLRYRGEGVVLVRHQCPRMITSNSITTGQLHTTIVPPMVSHDLTGAKAIDSAVAALRATRAPLRFTRWIIALVMTASLGSEAIQASGVVLQRSDANLNFSDSAHSAPPPSSQTTTVASNDGLAETPLDGELLGFTMRVPINASLRVERTPTANYLLAGAGETPTWRMRVSALTASKADSTAATQCAAYLEELRGKQQKFEVVLDEARLIAGAESRLLYISVPLEGGGKGITGTLIVPRAQDQYLVFSLVLLDAEFARVRPLLDRCFATIALKDDRRAALERLDLLGRGKALTETITPAMLRATIAPDPLFYRMRRPDANGDLQDFGYMTVRVREGKKGETDASRDAKTLKDEDAIAGLLATVDARVVVNADSTHTLDVQSRYFVAWDRSSECWSIRSTERHKRATRSNAQTGVRSAPSAGDPRPKLKVISATADGMTRTPQEWPLPPAYVSQAELIVLGQLLPHDLAVLGEAMFGSALESLEFMDYAFDQREEKLPQRRETWSRIASGFRLETQFGSAPAKLVQEFDASGRRMRRTDPDGTLTELIALDDLRKLWKSKGLPVD